MASKLRICGIEPESIVDGPGFRYVIFVQGCPHNCPGCHNPQSHDFNGGRDGDFDEIMNEIAQNPLLSGVTFSGGEPFCQAQALYELGLRVKETGKDLMIYSGWTIEQLMEKSKEDPYILKLLKIADVLVDGPFIMAQRDLELVFRGSSNQRVIDLAKYFAGEKEFCIED